MRFIKSKFEFFARIRYQLLLYYTILPKYIVYVIHLYPYFYGDTIQRICRKKIAVVQSSVEGLY